MLLRGRRLFSRTTVGPLSGTVEDAGESVPKTVRRLAQSPVYPRGLDGERSIATGKGTPTPRERLLGLMKNGRYCAVREMLAVVTAEECGAVMREFLASGHAFDRAGDFFRLRARQDREPRQRLAEVLDGIELVVSVEEDEPDENETVKNVGFDPTRDAGNVEEIVTDGLLVLSEPPGVLSLSLSKWGGSTRAILAKRGAGKTYFAGVMLEEVIPRAERSQVVVVDPGGVWWGLLSTSDGEPSLHKILLLGGPRGHFSLGAKDGVVAANIVCDVRPLPVILDLSELAPVEQHELVADFCERLWVREHFPLHVVVDEADEFAPQRFGALPRHQRRSLEALSRLFMRGRSRGIGGTLISLRPAVLTKNLLSQVDELVLLRLVESNDIRAAATWLENFEHQVTERQRTLCLSQLPVLPTGTAYFLRGGDDPTFRRFKVREKRTYDSSRTLVSGVQDNSVLSRPGPEVLAVVAKIFADATSRSVESGEDGDRSENE